MNAILIGNKPVRLHARPNVSIERLSSNHSGSIFLMLLLMMAMVNFGKFFGFGKEYYWFAYAVIIYSAVILLLFQRLDLAPKKLYLATFILFSYLLISALKSKDGLAVSAYFITNLFFIPVIAFFFGKLAGEVAFLRHFRVVAIILLPLCIIGFFYKDAEADYSGTLASGSVFGGVMSLITLIAALDYVWRRRASSLIVALMSFALLLMSAHRTGILALILSFYVYITARLSKNMFRFAAIQFVMMLFGGLIFYAIYKYNPQLILDQFLGEEISVETVRTSGRATIWPELIESYLSSWSGIIFGGGLGTAINVIRQSHPDTLDSIAVPHNEWLRILLDMGIVGLCSFIFFYKIVLFSFRDIRFQYLGYAIGTHLFCEMFFSNVIYWAGSYMFILMLYMGSLHGAGGAAYSQGRQRGTYSGAR